MKILVVDDDPDVREMLAMLIPAIWPGAWVRTARDAAEARRRLDRTIDVLLLADELGPGEDGMELMASIREYVPPTVAMVMTDDAAARFRRLGIVVLWKPFECYELKAAVERALALDLVEMRA